jgi:hypothetical protein
MRKPDRLGLVKETRWRPARRREAVDGCGAERAGRIEHHQGHGIVRGEIDPLPPDPDHGDLGQDSLVERVVAADRDRHVDRPFLDGVDQLCGAVHLEGQFHVRVVFGEAGEHIGQHGFGEVLRGPEPQRASRIGTRPEGQHRFIVGSYDPAGEAEQPLPGQGQGRLPIVAAKHRRSEIRFEALDLEADGGGRPPYQVSRFSKAPTICNQQEGPEHADIEVSFGSHRLRLAQL